MEKVILPYIDGVKDEHDLPLRQHSLCIFDVFKAHQKEELRDLLRKKNIHMVYVPASCTDRLQPLDLSVNASFKLNMKNCFEDWYSGEVAEQLKLKSPEDVEIKRIHHWCSVGQGNPNPRVHRSSGKRGFAEFPTGTVDPRVGISWFHYTPMIDSISHISNKE